MVFANGSMFGPENTRSLIIALAYVVIWSPTSFFKDASCSSFLKTAPHVSEWELQMLGQMIHPPGVSFDPGYKVCQESCQEWALTVMEMLYKQA